MTSAPLSVLFLTLGTMDKVRASIVLRTTLVRGKPNAFGNNNTGTPYGGLDNFGGEKKNQLNKFNGGGKTSPLPWESYHGCTFGLVGNTYGNDGKIQYMANSPKLFNDGTAIGKYPYDEGEYTLQFIRQGDTYTISAVNGAGLKGLENLSKGKNQYTLDIPMWTNHFWPMDTASTVSGSVQA